MVDPRSIDAPASPAPNSYPSPAPVPYAVVVVVAVVVTVWAPAAPAPKAKAGLSGLVEYVTSTASSWTPPPTPITLPWTPWTVVVWTTSFPMTPAPAPNPTWVWPPKAIWSVDCINSALI